MIPVIDVFAGPGGMNEGFASHAGGAAFSIAGSFEMDPIAVRTLRLRAAVRRLSPGSTLYKPYLDFLNGESPQALAEDAMLLEALTEAGSHVFEHELATETRASSDALIEVRLSGASDWVLIGGPPCQAYSLAGRARRTGETEFYEDHKHTLYREYLHIVEKYQPTVFVMENVKGLLSSKTAGGPAGTSTFSLILSDMHAAGYTVHSLVVAGSQTLAPRDFVIRSELFGIPQRRHRVILLGIRNQSHLGTPDLLQALPPEAHTTVRDALDDLPAIRSFVSRGDDEETWRNARLTGQALALSIDGSESYTEAAVPPTKANKYAKPRPTSELGQLLRRPDLTQVTLHSGRRHMRSDLERYAFLAQMATVGRTPRVNELPPQLRPAHRNLQDKQIPFTDRFKVQRAGQPSGTVTSHISKDGHYYIHYDPDQMRSLTVREAARLQTFPDDYFFMGNRTQQYHQVGNAVPPMLAEMIAGVVAKLLGA